MKKVYVIIILFFALALGWGQESTAQESSQDSEDQASQEVIQTTDEAMTALQGQLADLQARLEAAEIARDTERARAATLETSQAEANKRLAELETSATKLANNQAQLERLSNINDRLKEALSQEQSLRAEIEADYLAFQQQQEASSVNDAHEQELAELQSALEQSQAELATRPSAENFMRLREQRNDLVRQMARLKQEMAAQAQEANMADEHEQQLAELRAALEQSQMAAQTQEANMADEHEQQLAELRAALEQSQMAAQTQEANMADEHEQQLAELRAALEQSQAQLAASPSAEGFMRLRDQRNDLVRQMSQLKRDMNDQSEAMATQMREQEASQARITELEGKLADAANSNSSPAQPNVLVQRLSEQRNAMITRNRQLQAQLSDLRANGIQTNERLVELEGQLANSVPALQLERLREQRNRLVRDQAALKAQLNNQGSAQTEEVEHLKTQLELTINQRTDLIRINRDFQAAILKAQRDLGVCEAAAQDALITATTENVSTESAPDTTTESAPDTTTESAPDATTESVPDATTESAPDTTTSTTVTETSTSEAAPILNNYLETFNRLRQQANLSDEDQAQMRELVSQLQDVDDESLAAMGMSRYLVQAGDSLSLIAGERLGDIYRWPEILAANGFAIDDPNLIYPGMNLLIPPR
ncbi:MAG: LysM peptidoglycan-binding domain-containing protein [Deinococcales bacterium]